MSDNRSVLEVSRMGVHVQTETPFMRHWERELRAKNWIEIEGKFYPRGSIIERAANGRHTAHMPLRAVPLRAPRQLPR